MYVNVESLNRKSIPLTGIQALQLVSNKVPLQLASSKDKIYWTESGPLVSDKLVSGGKQSKKLPMPKIDTSLKVSVVRDLPKVKLSPIESTVPASTSTLQGIENSKKFIIPLLVVLGLIIVYSRLH